MKGPLRILAVVLIGGFPIFALLGADLVVVPRMEARLEQAAAQPGAESVDVQVKGFPVTARALATGVVHSVRFRYSEARVGPLRAEVRLTLEGVGFKRGRLLGGEVQLEGVESGRFELEIPYAQVERVLGREIDFGDAGAEVALTPSESVPLAFSATAVSLVVSADGLDAVTMALGSKPLPCAPETEGLPEGLLLSCPFRGLPGSLRT